MLDFLNNSGVLAVSADAETTGMHSEACREEIFRMGGDSGIESPFSTTVLIDGYPPPPR